MSCSPTYRTITVSAVVLRDCGGAVLTVRKRGTARFMLPGGKPEPGETPAQTALRETSEEIGVDLDPMLLVPLGQFLAPAANEAEHLVRADVFAHPWQGPVSAAGEIAELRWLRPDATLPEDLAPLLRDHVLPALARQPGASPADSSATASTTPPC